MTSFNEYDEALGGVLDHDDNGNLTDDGTRRYVWDGFNRLRRVTNLSGTTTIATYLYDADARRLRKDLPGLAGDLDYVYDGWQVIENYGHDDYMYNPEVPRRRFIYGAFINEPVVMEAEDMADFIRFYYHANTIYSIYGLSDSYGELVERYDYDPYGAHVLIVAGVRTPGALAEYYANPFTFTAHMLDPETGNHWMRMRYYHARLGRFVGRDPIGFQGGLSIYAYAGSSPCMAIDIMGLYDEDVHMGLTQMIAFGLGISRVGSALIASSNMETDTMFDPTIINNNNWMWHFDRSLDSVDSRLFLMSREFNRAAEACNYLRRMHDNADVAAQALGRALHPLQDYFAHGDFNRRMEAPSLGLGGMEKRYYWHNYTAPLSYSGSTSDVDNAGKDASGIAGRPTMAVMTLGKVLSNGDQVFWTRFHDGSIRISFVEQNTQDLLLEFIDYVRARSKPCGECRRMFLGE